MLSASGSAGLQTSNLLQLEQHMHIKGGQPSSSSSRILDIPCKVCGDFSSGKHYNIFACDGCAGFFKRSIRRNRVYVCKAKEEGRCLIDKPHRNQCRACRLKKCEDAGMNKDAVQHERGPRNSTLKRQQMSQYFQEDVAGRGRLMMAGAQHGGVLNLSLPRPESASPHLEAAFPRLPPPPYFASTVLPLPLPPTPPLQLLPPSLLDPATICETAARLLFINVQWTKSIPAFTMLPLPDQLLLLEESWRELFILAASKCLDGVNMANLVQSTSYMKKEGEKNVVFQQEVKDFQSLLSKLNQFQLDPQEFACIRAIALFKTTFERPSSLSPSPSERRLTDPTRVTMIQDESQLTLNRYLRAAYPTQPLRFGKLLMLLPTLRTISSETIEELFFRKAIDNIPIVKIICNMYVNNNQQFGL